MKTLVRPLGLIVAFLAALVAGPADAQVYPNAKTGGNYMHNYYFAPAASSTASCRISPCSADGTRQYDPTTGRPGTTTWESATKPSWALPVATNW